MTKLELKVPDRGPLSGQTQYRLTVVGRASTSDQRLLFDHIGNLNGEFLAIDRLGPLRRSVIAIQINWWV